MQFQTPAIAIISTNYAIIRDVDRSTQYSEIRCTSHCMSPLRCI